MNVWTWALAILMVSTLLAKVIMTIETLISNWQKMKYTKQLKEVEVHVDNEVKKLIREQVAIYYSELRAQERKH